MTRATPGNGAAVPGGTPFAIAIVVIGGLALVGFLIAVLIPRPAPEQDRQAA
jgi:hypothetical protein